MIVYNLEFPENVTELTLDGYVFRRLPNYTDNYSKMMWLVNSSGSEFSTHEQTGSHQQTASVEEINKSVVLPWANSNHTRLNDICLFLFIFTGRNVFAIEEAIANNDPTLISDHRIYHYGGILRCSIPFKEEFFDEETLQPLTEEQRAQDEFFFLNSRDIGFGEGLNKVLELMSTTDWFEKYGGGYFLFLFKQAMQRMDMEPTFILCWAIWEHLFAVLNTSYTDAQLERDISAEFKITYFFQNYFNLVLNRNSRTEIKRIVKARHKLVHHGKKPDNVDLNEMDLFIRATECLVCKILELEPSNVFNTNEKLARFLKLN